jgi:hypothetical protein
MTDTVKLEWSDICRHEHRCEGASCNNWLYHTVPSYSVYVKAYRWLRERGCKLISAEREEEIVAGDQWRYTGRYTFKFLCEQEYMWFKLRWS